MGKANNFALNSEADFPTTIPTTKAKKKISQKGFKKKGFNKKNSIPFKMPDEGTNVTKRIALAPLPLSNVSPNQSLEDQRQNISGTFQELEDKKFCTVQKDMEKNIPFAPLVCGCDGNNLKSDIRHAVIKKYAKAWARCFNNFEVPSLIEQMHFLLDFLLLPNKTEEILLDVKGAPFGKGFSTCSDLFHFAQLTFRMIVPQNFLKLFTTTTLKDLQQVILQNNCPKSEKLVGSLTNEISCRKKRNNPVRKSLDVDNTYLQKTVNFNHETDNRSQFRTDRAFDSFIKQRDQFYKLFNGYQASDFKNSESKIKEVIELVSVVRKMSTYKSFSRLFIRQLVQKGLSTREVDFLSVTHLDDTSKPMIHPPITYPNERRHSQFRNLSFFKEFVKISDSHSLNNYLFAGIHRMIRQTENDFITQSEVTGLKFDPDTCFSVNFDDFKQTLFKLRLLGHFYGFLTFYPYKYSADKPSDIYEMLPQLISSVCDFCLSSLQTAISNGHIIVTLAWIVPVLSFVSTSMPWINKGSLDELLEQLVQLYLQMRASKVFRTFHFYVVSMIGSLFEPVTLGFEQFYHYSEQKVARCKTSGCSWVNPSFTRYTLADDLVNKFNPSYELLITTHWKLTNFEAAVQAARRQSPPAETCLLNSPSICSTELLPMPPKMRTSPEIQYEFFFFRLQPSSLLAAVRFMHVQCYYRAVKFAEVYITSLKFQKKM